jgi:hypothetical protein
MKRSLLIVLVLICLIPLGMAAAENIEPPPQDPQVIAAVEQAILEAVSGEREFMLPLFANAIAVENVEISSSGEWAVAYLVPYDPETDEPVPTEPGLVLTRRERDEWLVWLPTSEGWIEMVKSAPNDILSPAHKETWTRRFETAAANIPSAPLGGYLLPWAAGITRNLTQSTCHDAYTPSGNAHYAFDFSTYKVMWEIYAAKGGQVWLWKDDVETCLKDTCNKEQPLGNYIVLKDPSTNPVTYQLYLHLKQDSIPDELKVKGLLVLQGQFIGVVDNTGQSWGHHLHFQVQVPLYGENYYWGQSVDITFGDVDINGGRPRLQSAYCDDKKYCTRPDDVCNSFRAPYTSANIPTDADLDPPVGDMLKPFVSGGTIYSDTLSLQGWATDERSGIGSAQFMARYNGAWHDIGPAFADILFEYEWDWCADNAPNGVPDGPVSVALRLIDSAGNQAPGLPGLRQIVKHFACTPQPPPPDCSPTAVQVAIFSEINYGSTCQVYGIGSYANSALFNLTDNNNAESILVGANVMATLFTDPNYGGRSETISADDANLDENRIGANTVSSFKVTNRTTIPETPVILWPDSGAVFSETESIDLAWNDAGGGSLFQASLDGPLGLATIPWNSTHVWNLGTVITGTYTWTVKAKGPTGLVSAASIPHTFTVVSDTLVVSPTFTAPFSDTLESDTGGWSASGLWNLTTTRDRNNHDTTTWWFGQATEAVTPIYGDLTTPPITLPVTSSPYLLTFWYRNETESSHRYWDQRWVQVSMDGDPFTNTLQLVDDPIKWWQNVMIDLTPYYSDALTHTLRVRFHFNSLDEIYNVFEGWFIDDIQVKAGTLPICGDANEPNDTPGAATAIIYGDTVAADICPGEDYDDYTFIGSAGDRIEIDIDAMSAGSTLDSILFLLDSDGRSVLAEHDDEVLTIDKDPLLRYQLPRTGQYYLLLRAWDHPAGSGPYTLTLTLDNTDPEINLIEPTSGSQLPDGKIALTANVIDTQSGVSHVEFLWHSGDWQNDDWLTISSDEDGSDGWSTTFDTTALSVQSGIAFYARAYDWAGNWAADLVWDLFTGYKSLLPYIAR